MMTTAYADPAALFGIRLLRVRNSAQRSPFGDVALAAFLLAQCFDGVFTYVGVVAFGIGIEANPVVTHLMTYLGHGPGLVSVKMLAAFLGIWLHFRQVHGAVAVLTGLYLAAAIAPWTLLLFF